MKWIELLKDVGEHKAGKFVEVEDNIARSYIDAGLAKDGGDGPETILLQRSLDKFGEKLQGFVKGTADQIEAATQQILKRPLIRTGDGQGVEFGSIANGESEADKSKGIGDFVRTTYIAIASVMQGDLESARTAHERLTKDYGVQRTGSSSQSLERGMVEGQGSSLGYTTPVIYESQILAEAAEEQVFVKNARKVPLGARQVEWPALDQYSVPTSGNSAFFGGVQVYRKGENVQRSQTAAKTKKVKLIAQDMTALFELSRDLMQDSTATLDSMIPMLGGEAIGWRTDWEAINGTGAGQLYGLYNHPATLQVARAVSGHFTYADYFAMFVRLLPRAKKGAAWYVHPFAMSDIMKLKDDSGRNVYLPVIPGTLAGPIAGQVTGTLGGLPIVETEKAAPPGSPGDVNLFAMDRYLYGERSGLEVGLSEHFLFDTDQIAIRLKVRNDGKPQLLKPITLGDGAGTNQVSAFVSLQ